ncbi:MAG TPA: DUF58 domain-containing protein [Acidimicrobiales bacterium]|nr:DUF58 domain-containing protein [Acidimicrobiales bacterium]
MHLTRLGTSFVVTCVVLFAGGLGLGLTAVVALAIAGLALVLLAITAVVESPAIGVCRTASPREVERDAPAEVTLQFTPAPRRKQRPFTVIETVAGVARAAAMPALNGGQVTSLTYELDTSHRGTLTAGPMLLRRMDPFGLVVADRSVSGSLSIAVRPRRHHLRMLPTGRQRDLEGPTREVSEGSASFHQLREYVPGDDLRHIHWRTSARTGTLVVKQLVDTTKPEIVVIVDNRTVAVRTPSDFEEIVEVAASVLHAADQDGFPAQLVFADGNNEVNADSVSLSHLERLTDVQPTDADSMLELAEALRARGRSLVFITGELSGPDLTLVARIASGFSPAYVVSVVGDRRSPFVPPPGVTGLSCSSAVDFTFRWGALR